MRACWCVRPPVDAGFCLHELVRVISLRRAPSSRPPRNQVKELLHRRGELLRLLEGRGEWLNGPFNDRLFLESSALGDSRYEVRVYTNLVMECTSVPLTGHQAVHTGEQSRDQQKNLRWKSLSRLR